MSTGSGKSNRKYLKSFFSGGSAGIVAKTFVAPFERIKILFIVSDRKFTYSKALEDLKFIIKSHSITSLWRGHVANILRIFPYSAIQFSSFDYYRETSKELTKSKGKLVQDFALFWSGAFSGMTATLLTYPLEFLRTRLAMEKGQQSYTGMRSAVKIILRREKIWGFYSGIGISLLGIIPYHGSAFFLFSKMKQIQKKEHLDGKFKLSLDFILGGISGFLSQLISYPFDVLRKRMQAQEHRIHLKEETVRRNSKEFFVHIINNEGLPGLYKGISLNLVKGPIAVGISWTVKNSLNRALDSKYDM